MGKSHLFTCIIAFTLISCKDNVNSSSLTEGETQQCTPEKLTELQARLIIAKRDAQTDPAQIEPVWFDSASAAPYEESYFTKEFFEPYEDKSSDGLSPFGLTDDDYHQCMQRGKEAAATACAADATCSSASAIMKEHSPVWKKAYEEVRKTCAPAASQGNTTDPQGILLCDIAAIHDNPGLEGVCKNPADGLCYNFANRFIEHTKPVACPNGSVNTPISGEGTSATTTKIESVSELEASIKQCKDALAQKPVPSTQPSKPVEAPKPEAASQNTGNTPSRASLDCLKDYSKIRTESTEGICRNSSSGICYRYGSGNVKYDQGAVKCEEGDGQINVKPTAASPAASGQSAESKPTAAATSSNLDCNADYSKIRAGGSGICLNKSSGLCYRYGNNDVQYGQGQVACQ